MKKSDHLSYNIISEIDSILDISIDIGSEIDGLSNFTSTEYVFPELSLGEKELLEIEMKMAKLQIILLFTPILFLTLVLISNMDFINQVILFGNTVFIIGLYSKESDLAVDLIGWTDMRSIVKSNYNYLLTSPYSQVIKFDQFIINKYNVELGERIIPKKRTGPHLAVQSIFHILFNFNLEVNQVVLNEFLLATKQLPSLENTYNQKKSVYKTQFTIISFAVSFFIVIMSSMVMLFDKIYVIYNNQIPMDLFLFSSNSSSLGYLTIFLTIFIIYFFSQEFYVQSRRLLFTIFLLLCSLIFYFIITQIFISLIL